MVNNIDNLFTNVMDDDPYPLDQKQAGLCWACAAITIFRAKLIKKYSLPKNFSISLNHILFWDKLEKSNYFMEYIIHNRKKAINNPLDKNNKALKKA
jgi:bleomycin hydrolase